MAVMSEKIRTYSELSMLDTYEDRLLYLELRNKVGEETFGLDRYINQIFYKNPEWLSIRDYVIIRDNGCDLGVPGFEIVGEPILVHHLNPISKEDILDRADWILNPDYLITTRLRTHNAIHYGVGDYFLRDRVPIKRCKHDTSPWRK